MSLPRTPSLRLDGRRALVSGGTRGIGLGAATVLAEAGAHVTIAARTAADIDTAVAALEARGLDADGVALDVTDVKAIASFIDAEAPYDILVNSAGGARHAQFLDVTEADYEAILTLNLKSALFLSQRVAKRLIAAGRPGSIIHISSQMGHVGGPKRTVYAASKFAVEGLTKSMAIELGPHNIRVNTIAPTFVETEMSATSLSDPDFRSWVLGKIKLGRLAQVEDIMGPVLLLASDAGAMITGSTVMVDGGWTAE
ncbi:MAG: SDR family oxidoreductase [Alphaproteobacteria bacterium]|nr:MAG: SDR family oxidoreductase [Alphaproteobacteria bacterium]